MPYSYTLSTVIPASPAEIYRAWLDSVAHSEMTGGEATMSDQVGADVSAWDGYITGRNLELVPGERIVQSWRTTEFDDEFEDLDRHHPVAGDRRRHALDASAQQRARRAQELRRRRLAVELFRADDRLFRRAGGRRSRRAGAGPPPVSAPTPAATKAPSARRKARAGKRRTIKSSARKAKSACSSEEAEGGRTRDKSCQESVERRGKKAAKKSSPKSAAKTSARRGAAKKATRASASRSRKPARGKRR